MVKHPLDNFNACDDFFILIVKCHILAAAMGILKMTTTNEIPFEMEDFWMEREKKYLNPLQLT